MEHLSYEERLRKLGFFSLDCSLPVPERGSQEIWRGTFYKGMP